mmetsp:Transcript_72567/g.235802  ORF Transcript_72567/g.235802 Transcript_72567/m.235802 type:complete len:1050 (+) Transcript_72567:114-3263(+)
MLNILSFGWWQGRGRDSAGSGPEPDCLEDGGELLLPESPPPSATSPRPSESSRLLPRILTNRHLFAALSPMRTTGRKTTRNVWGSSTASRLPHEEAADPRLDPEQVQELESRLRICADLSSYPTLAFDVDEARDKVVLYKNHSLSRSCLLHFAIVREASDRECGAYYVRRILERGADVHAKARYKNPNGTETEFEAIHIAAGLGCKDILEVLLDFAVYRQVAPEFWSEHAAEFVSNWAKIVEGGEHDCQPIVEKNYQPIHDAAFGRQKGTLEWLLHKGADAGSPNLHGFNALHFLALNGLTDDSPETIEEVVRTLRAHDRSSTILNATTNEKHHLEHFRHKIPLEFAATGGSQFPKNAMYLLAPSHWEANGEPRYFEDLLLLANSNTTHAADALARKICEKASQGTTEGSMWRSRVRKEAQKWVDDPGLGQCGASTLACLFFMVPNAAADMVDILVAKPLVQDAAKHPIPSRAILKAPQLGKFLGGGYQPMLCSYQGDSSKFGDLIRPEWKFDADESLDAQDGISWHRDLVHECPDHHISRRDDIHAVSMKTILWPNILDLDLCRALVCMPSINDKIFSRLPVQAIVFWFWNHVGFPAFVITWCLCLIEVLALVKWGLGNEGHSDQHYPVCRSLVLAGTIRGGVNLLWCFKEYSVRWWKHRNSDSGSVLRFLWEPTGFLAENCVEVMSVILRASLLVFMDERDMDSNEADFGQALMAVNVMFGFSHLTYMLRMLDGMGKGILAIWETFFSGTIQQMLLICSMVFVNFFLAFIMLAKDRDPTEVFLQLYRGFFFGDGGALDALGLDVSGDEYGRVQLGPIMVNMNRVLALMGTSFFTVIILNLIIAIYSNEYDKIKRDAELLFMKHRLRMSCDFVLSHRKLSGPTPRWLSLLVLPATLVLTADLFCAQPWLPWSRALSRKACLTAASLLLAVAQLIVQMVVLQGMGQHDDVHLQVHEGEPRFLWICHRSDFNADDTQEVTKEDLKHLSEDVNKKVAELDQAMGHLGNRLEAKMDQVMEMFKKSLEAQEARTTELLISGGASGYRSRRNSA